MGNISSAFQDALAGQAKAALVEVAAANPKITVKDLSDLVAANPHLGGLTLSELLGGAPASGKVEQARGGRSKAPAAAQAAPAAAPAAFSAPRKAAAPRKGGAHKRNVRTEPGREAFDEEVFSTLKELGGDAVSATPIRTVLDADPTQLRAALNRLIERGLVTFMGKARGTRYSLA